MRVLRTLDAEGPSAGDASKTAFYRDRLELISADEKRTTSSVLGEDGTWTVEARRVEWRQLRQRRTLAT